MLKRLLITVFFLVAVMSLVVWASVNTTLEDFHLAGTQPNQVTIEAPNRCGNCHDGYDPSSDIYTHWQGSMMSQAMRDPLFRAFMVIANQDAPESGDLCIRCHTPEGWLEGRSLPTDGSSLTTRDFEGITCDFCHKLVKPTPLGVNPYPDDPDYTTELYDKDQADLATLEDIPVQSGNGMYIVSGQKEKRGPFVDANAKHPMSYSPFHKEADLCGTCHDVSNPAFDRNPDNTYTPNVMGFRNPSSNTYDMFPVERTYSEWLMSEYNTAAGVPSDVFGGNKANVSTCQDCHMRDVTAVGCNKRGIPIRDDQPLHDLTGGNTFILSLIGQLYPDDVNQADLDAGILRARAMLQSAATMNVTVAPDGTQQRVDVRIINETGHKLPSGYPEGRRIWINVKAFDDAGGLLYESGAYDNNTGVLTHDADVKIYEIKPGISTALAPALGLDAGPSFHFVLNHEVFKDNRIPPRGFTNANYELIQSPVVDYSYPDGQYWDNSSYLIPGNAASVEVSLYYQTTSKEFIEFIRDENYTDNSGQEMYDLWFNNGKSAPELMNQELIIITTNPPVANFSGSPVSGNVPLTVSFADLSTNAPTAWNWNFGDGNSSTLQNPSHVYDAIGTYTVSMTATNAYGSDSETKTDYITVTENTTTDMYISALTVTRQTKGKRSNGLATVTVMDIDGLPVSGAVVTGDYTGASTEAASGTTDAGGVAEIKSSSVRNPAGEFCFAVTDVAKSGFAYNASLNAITSACESGPVAKLGELFLPVQIWLAQNYPNPFNPSTAITYNLPQAANVQLDIYNVRGQKIATLINSLQDAGEHTVSWNAATLTSGVYLYRLTVGDFVTTKKMLLVK